MRAIVLLLPLFLGCALTSRGTPEEIRYFSPADAPMIRASNENGEPSPRARVLLGRVTSSANLRYHIVYRRTAVETGEYETLRWTETPENYVRRSLTSALLADRIELVTAGNAPSLDVDVIGFEEVRRDPSRSGRVELRYQLRDDHAVLANDVVVAERDAKGLGFEPVVLAIGAAMDAATQSVAAAVARRLGH
jgi:uncharacterized lipoprotein YmbA